MKINLLWLELIEGHLLPFFGHSPILGAIAGELICRRDLKLAAKAALGIVVGSLVGNLNLRRVGDRYSRCFLMDNFSL